MITPVLKIMLMSSMLGAFHASLANETPTYNIEHYDMLIQPDFKSKQLSVRVAVAIGNPALEKAFTFGLNDSYGSVSVTCSSSRAVAQRDSGLITVSVEKPTKRISLVFDIKGAPGRSQDEDRDVIDEHSLFLLWSDRFYPIDFNDWATVKTTIVLPPNFQAIAPGKLTGVRRVDDKDEYTFEARNPAVGFSVFADSRWIKTERTINGLRMQTLLHPESQKFAEQIFSTSSEILKFYSETFCPYPFDQFSFVTLNGMYARRAFAGFVGYDPAYLEKEFTTTGHDAHETALLWWGYTIRGKGLGSSQWLEGFGDYAEILYDEKYHKPLPKIFRYFREKYLTTASENDLLYTELRGSTDQAFVHGKYPWLMHLVRYAVGDNQFRRAMKLVFETFKFRAFTMDEFLATLEEGSGQSLQWFRDEWLQRRGVPAISLKSEIEQKDGAYQITCALEQLGNVYRLPVEIGIETEEGTRIERVSLSERQTTVSFLSKERPKRILLDPNDSILMKRGKR